MPQPWNLGFTFAPVLAAPAAGAPADAPLQFSGVAYSGDVVPGYSYLGDIAIDLGTLKNPLGQVPVLVDHDARVDAIAGKGALSLEVDATGLQTLKITGTLTQATPAGQRMAALLREGFPIQMSVGLQASLRETTAPESINGRTLAVRHVFENATVREVSFVPTGADADTHASAFAFSAAAAPLTDPTVSPPSGPKEGQATMTRSAEDQALFDKQAAEIASLKAQAEQAARTARTAALSALCVELGREVPAADKLAPYLDMSEAQFSAYAADLRALKAATPPGRPGADPQLFTAQSAGRATSAAGAQPADKLGTALLSAVTHLTKK
jgi:HK97 family phage prohead protease